MSHCARSWQTGGLGLEHTHHPNTLRPPVCLAQAGIDALREIMARVVGKPEALGSLEENMEPDEARPSDDIHKLLRLAALCLLCCHGRGQASTPRA